MVFTRINISVEDAFSNLLADNDSVLSDSEIELPYNLPSENEENENENMNENMGKNKN